MTNYFVAIGDVRSGPFSLEQLANGTVPLTPDSLVWKRGMPAWSAAATIVELADLLGPALEEPPSYTPVPGSDVSHRHSNPLVVARWIILYAVAVRPALWLIQRVANLADLFRYPTDPEFAGIALMFLIWGLLTLTVTGVVLAGGLHATARSQPKPRLLRIGLGISIAFNLFTLIVYAALFGHASAVQAAGEASQSGLFTGIVDYVMAVLWLIGVMLECHAWVKLARINAAPTAGYQPTPSLR